MREPDIIINATQVTAGTLIIVDAADLPSGAAEGDHIVVGDHGATSAAAVIIERRKGEATLRVLP